MQVTADDLMLDALAWMLEPDPRNPGVRYNALRDLLCLPEDDVEVQAACHEVMLSGPIPAILDAQHPDGYWARPGGGYAPSYRSTLWQVIFLAELGADPEDERVRRSCEYLLCHSVASNGGFSMSERPVPSTVVHCLNGDPLHALLRLGWADDPRVQAALEWQVQAITGEGDVRYYRSGTPDKGFACVANGSLPCAWGAVKALKALGVTPQPLRTPQVAKAIDMGVRLLLGRDLSQADYPSSGKISSGWFAYSFPLSYRSDILEAAGVLADLGYGDDPRLANAHRAILDKRDALGGWTMERSLNGKTWVDIEEKKRPSKWITLRALCTIGYRSGPES